MAMRVLFPLDGSERSLAAMEHGVAMLKGATLDATVLIVQTKGFEHASADMIEKFDEDAEDEIFPNESSAVSAFRAATKRVRGKGVRLRFKSVKGNVLKEILAESANHDLLVMHALSVEKRGLIHVSRAKAIAKKASCSVLLVADEPGVR